MDDASAADELKGRAGKAFELARSWLLKSGAFVDPAKKGASAGCVLAGYDVKRRRWLAASTRASGYALSFCLRLRNWLGDRTYLEYAKQIGGYLLGIQAKGGPGAGAFPRSHRGTERVYLSFDTAVCLASLCELYTETGEAKWLDAAGAAARWLIDEAQNADGSFKAAFYPEKGRFDAEEDEDLEGSSFLPTHAKATVAFVRYFQVASEHRFLLAAHKAGGYGFSVQSPVGYFPQKAKGREVLTRAHCYSAEAACFLYYKTGDRRALASFESATDWLLSRRGRSGGFSATYNSFTVAPKLALGATAQAARLFCIRHRTGGPEKHREAMRAALEFVLGLQCHTDRDLSCWGGFFAGRLGLPLVRRTTPMINTRATLFAAHALRMSLSEEMDAERLSNELF